MSVALHIRDEARRLTTKISVVAESCDEETLIDLGLVVFETIKELRRASTEILRRLKTSDVVAVKDRVGLFAKATLKPPKPKVASVSQLEADLKEGRIRPEEFFDHFVIRGIDVRDSTLASIPPRLRSLYVDANTTERVEFNERTS